jgi:hypothetical protein
MRCEIPQNAGALKRDLLFLRQLQILKFLRIA